MKMKFAYYTFILLWAVCLMTGCSIYKPYSRPEVQTEGLYRDLEETRDTASIATLGWRNLFSDKNLQALIEKGLERNTNLRVAHIRVKAAEAVLMNARLSYLPSVVLTPDGSISGTEGAKAIKTYNLAASASWEIDLFGKVTNAKREALAALEGSRAYRQAVETQLIATIANSYYMLLMLDRQLIISEQTLITWKETEHSIEALKRAGKSNDAAVLQAKRTVWHWKRLWCPYGKVYVKQRTDFQHYWPIHHMTSCGEHYKSNSFPTHFLQDFPYSCLPTVLM